MIVRSKEEWRYFNTVILGGLVSILHCKNMFSMSDLRTRLVVAYGDVEYCPESLHWLSVQDRF